MSNCQSDCLPLTWYCDLDFFPSQSIITVTVLNSNDAPSEIVVSSSLTNESQSNSLVIPENIIGGTSLANLTVRDEDDGQDHKCSLLGGEKYFYITRVSEISAEMFLQKNVALDYETMQDLVITGESIASQGAE